MLIIQPTMPRAPKLIPGRLTKAGRRRQRKDISLEGASLTDQTRVRYYAALRKVTPYLERISHEHQLDDVVSQWVTDAWTSGEPLLVAGDGLSALHYFQPWTRRMLPQAWKLFRTWRRIEVPFRAPPLTKLLVRSMAFYELDRGHIEMATMLLVGFHCLLRTGEFLALTAGSVLLGPSAGILNLADTKTSRKHAAHDAISITDSITLEVLRTLVEMRQEQGLTAVRLWNASPQCFRTRFNALMKLYGLEAHCFRPYSLRRGGATALFQETNSMEMVLTRGRWQSSKIARVYITDGLSYLPSIRPSATTKKLLKQFHFVSATQG